MAVIPTSVKHSQLGNSQRAATLMHSKHQYINRDRIVLCLVLAERVLVRRNFFSFFRGNDRHI